MPTTVIEAGPTNSPSAASGWSWDTTPKPDLAAAGGGDGFVSLPVGTPQSMEFAFPAVPNGVTPTSLIVVVSARRNVGSSAMDIRINIVGVQSSDISLGTSLANKQNNAFSGLGTASGGAGLTYTVTLSAVGTAGDQMIVDYAQAALTWNSLPSAPTSLTPINGATVGTLLPTFTGTRVDPDNDNMTAVQIEVRRNSDNALMWSSGDLAQTGTTFSKAYAGTTLVNGTVYKWRARTKEAAGYGEWSNFQTFTPQVNVNPTASLVSPIGGAQVGTLAPNLTLNFSDPDAGTAGEFAAYQVQVRRVSDGQSFWDPGSQTTTAPQKAARQAVVAYAGTALANGTAYEWRARVTDGAGGVSDYTSWAAFTPQAAPNAPTLTSPSGLTNTLTPTIQGVYNQGAGATQAAFQYEIRQAGVLIYQSGDVATAIATGQAYGTNNPSDTPSTPPALAWGTSYTVRARSKDSNGAYSEWTSQVAFNTNAAPTTPTNLTPNGGITGDTTPTLAWQHNDPDGDAQTVAEIELYVIGGSAVSGYDPKELTQSGTTHDVTETLDDSPEEYQWRVRTKGLAGPGFGPWSDWATFTVANAPIITVSEPDTDEVFSSPAFLVEWAFSGGSGTQASYRVRVYAEDQVSVAYDSGIVAGEAESHQIPGSSGLRNNRTYYVRLSVIDTLDQAADSGFIRIVTTWTPPSPIVGLQAVAVGDQTPGGGA